MSEIKMTFGLQGGNMQHIEQSVARWNQYNDPDDTDRKDWVLYEHWFWERMGEDIGWQPLSLALHYLRKRDRAIRQSLEQDQKLSS